MNLQQLGMLLFLVTSVIQFFKQVFTKEKLHWENLVAFFLGGSLVVAYNVDFLALAGLPAPTNLVANYILQFIVMGLSASLGAGFLYDLTKRARAGSTTTVFNLTGLPEEDEGADGD